MKRDICMLVVTFNRKELLLRNIKAVIEQSYHSDIFIYDNHSTDGTASYLEDNGLLKRDDIHYFYSSTNIGGAGGFSDGMKRIYNLGYHYIWLMDDDGYCWNSDTLKLMIEKIPLVKEEFILNSTVICDKNRSLTFGFEDINSYEKLCDRSKDGLYKGFINPFNSTLISRKCIDTIGFPKGEFFIYGDEHEYMLRALKNSIDVSTVIDSLYYHPVNRRIETKKIWRYEVPLKDEPVWKTFCDTRNSLYITKKYYSKKMILIRIYIALCAALFKKNKKKKYLKYTLLAIRDALHEDFSRPIMFNV